MLKLHCTYRPSKQVEGEKKSKNMGYVHVNHRVSGHSLVGTYEIQQKKISWKNQRKPVQSIQSSVDLCNVLQSSSSQWPTQFGKQCTKEALHAHSGALLVQHITFMWGTSAPCPHVPLEAKAFVQLHYYRITLLMQTETAVHFMRNWKRLHANQMLKSHTWSMVVVFVFCRWTFCVPRASVYRLKRCSPQTRIYSYSKQCVFNPLVCMFSSLLISWLRCLKSTVYTGCAYKA